MLVACRLAGLSALKAHYADVRVRAQFGPTQRSRRPYAASAIRGSELVARGLSCPALWREPGKKTRGPPGAAKG
jgi:hypothetical protein